MATPQKHSTASTAELVGSGKNEDDSKHVSCLGGRLYLWEIPFLLIFLFFFGVVTYYGIAGLATLKDPFCSKLPGDPDPTVKQAYDNCLGYVVRVDSTAPDRCATYGVGKAVELSVGGKKRNAIIDLPPKAVDVYDRCIKKIFNNDPTAKFSCVIYGMEVFVGAVAAKNVFDSCVASVLNKSPNITRDCAIYGISQYTDQAAQIWDDCHLIN
eukprot:Colp12_sorted_trinity150504_noHs@1446